MAFLKDGYTQNSNYSMKRSILSFMLVLFTWASFASCKKQIEEAKSDALADYLAANKWAVQQYLEGSTDVTNDFTGYEFQFFKNYTVTGTNGTVSYTGNWHDDLTAITISAQFTNGALPVTRLNGTWSVSTYNSTATTFGQTINGVEMKLILRKK
jgi:hypothetical protein